MAAETATIAVAVMTTPNYLEWKEFVLMFSDFRF